MRNWIVGTSFVSDQAKHGSGEAKSADRAGFERVASVARQRAAGRTRRRCAQPAKEDAMPAKSAIAAAAALAAVMLIGAASAHPSSSTQRIGLQSATGGFTLSPLSAGPIKRDHGSVAWGTLAQHDIRRHGQAINVNDLNATLLGARGSLLIRLHIEWTDAGHDFVIGQGRWTILRGTGAYKGLTGGGFGSSVMPPRGDGSWRDEGLVASP
jgi:hypothetical protein